MAAFTMDKGELMRFVKDCDLLGDHDNGVPFLTRNELDLMFIRANWDGPMGRALAPSVTLPRPKPNLRPQPQPRPNPNHTIP